MTLFYATAFRARTSSMPRLMMVLPARVVAPPVSIYVIVRCTDSFLENGLYCCRLNLAMHSAFSKLWYWRYEALLSQFEANDGVHEHDRLGDVAPLDLQIGV